MKTFRIILLFISGLLLASGCSDSVTNNYLLESNAIERITRISDDEVAISKIIDGAVGGSIDLTTVVINSQNESIQISANLVISPGSFQGVQEVQMIPNFAEASVSFYPPMNFDKQLNLNLTFTGLDLAGLGFTHNSKVNFVYVYENGDIEPVSYSACKVIGLQKALKVVNAKLSHFSRYIFMR